MKKVFNVIVLFLCMGVFPVYAQTGEEQAVLSVARAETEASLKGDLTAWKACFIQNEKTNSLFSGRGYFLPVNGWSKLSARAEQMMKTRGQPSRYNTVSMANVIFNGGDKMATLVYDQNLTAKNVDSIPLRTSREYRTLIKENNKWKIASMVSNDTLSYTSTRPQDVEDEINAIGYNFLFAKQIDKAIEVFKFNVQMYPNSWNPYDSLGEGYAAAGNKQQAILNYEKSIQLNPKNDNGIKILGQLKVAK